uniref:Uncharacterized protein n=1 Tax=uncultured marine virus TaxID=186617 RepID=A0A0F7L9V0_9VIRU|nr:hypothetical protein [uncultured marine virus]
MILPPSTSENVIVAVANVCSGACPNFQLYANSPIVFTTPCVACIVLTVGNFLLYFGLSKM